MKSQQGIPEILKSQEVLPLPRKQSLNHAVSISLVSKTCLWSPLRSIIWQQNSLSAPNEGLVFPKNYLNL